MNKPPQRPRPPGARSGPKRATPRPRTFTIAAPPPVTPDPPVESVDLQLTDMAYGGEAVGRAARGVVFAWGGIAGEQVTAQVDHVKRDLTWATVTDVIDPSPLRTVPPCPYFGPCGGCQWQQITYPGQLAFKTGILRDQLQRTAGLAAGDVAGLVQDALGTPPWEYRNVAHFQVDPVSRKLGFFSRGSHSVVPVEVCPISDPGINALLPEVQALFAQYAQARGDLPPDVSELDLEAVRRGQMPVSLRERKPIGLPIWQVTIRTGAPPLSGVPTDTPWAGREMTVIVHTLTGDTVPAPRSRRDGETDGPRPTVLVPRKALRRWVDALPGHVSLVELRADGSLEEIGATTAAAAAVSEDAAEVPAPARVSGSRRAAVTAAAEDLPEAPPGVVRQQLGGGRYWVAPQAFFQVNNAGAEAILALVQTALPQPVDLLVDAYSGVGAFALALLAGGHAARVIAIESDWPAVESARWTAALRGVGADRLQLERGRVEDVLPGLKIAPDVVLLDPPRSGCASGLIRYLLAAKVPRLIYVSCDPSTFARDVKALAPAYRLTRAQPVDLFPQTYHIETVAVLDRIAAP